MDRITERYCNINIKMGSGFHLKIQQNKNCTVDVVAKKSTILCILGNVLDLHFSCERILNRGNLGFSQNWDLFIHEPPSNIGRKLLLAVSHSMRIGSKKNEGIIVALKMNILI